MVWRLGLIFWGAAVFAKGPVLRLDDALARARKEQYQSASGGGNGSGAEGAEGGGGAADSGGNPGGVRRGLRRAAALVRDFAMVLVLAVLLVFIVLLFEFGSFAAPVAILSSALLSTSGVFLALLVTGTTFNISSFMGLIMVIGIVAKNGILLLDADQKFRREGIAAEESMIRAGERRLRPIAMTALATVAGMIPLALAWGAGSQMLQPLAITVIGGILASMILSLVVTPAVHYYMRR
jgi:multidrug efflux pump subunit AcrB